MHVTEQFLLRGGDRCGPPSHEWVMTWGSAFPRREAAEAVLRRDVLKSSTAAAGGGWPRSRVA